MRGTREERDEGTTWDQLLRTVGLVLQLRTSLLTYCGVAVGFFKKIIIVTVVLFMKSLID